MKKITTFAAALTSVLLVAGCSSETGTPEPTEPTANGEQPLPDSNQPDNNLPHSGAPAVEDPIDTTQWEADPCATLSEDELAKAGFPIRKEELNPDARGGPTCNWSVDPAGSGVLGVGFVTGTPEGLSALYRSNENGGYDDWEILDPIRGYPAVAAGMGEERRNRGDCIIAVGIRDDRIFSAGTTGWRDEGADAPCDVAVEIAGMVIDTMTEGD